MDYLFNASFFAYFVQNVSTIIGLLIGITLLVAIVVLYFQFFQEQSAFVEGHGTVGLSPEVEQSLKKILDAQATSGAQRVAVAKVAEGGLTVSSPEVQMKLEETQNQLIAKEKEIEALRVKIASTNSTAVAGGGGNKQLEDRIKELEARLAEYEIIAEDIADLSFYKEENQKLVKQMESLKGGAAPAAATPQAPAAAPAVAEPPAATVPELAQTASPSVAETPQQTEPSVAAAVPEAPMATVTPINAAVAAKIDAAAAAPADATAATAEVPATAAPSASDEELMKEFAAAVEAQKADAVAKTTPDKAENTELMGQFEEFVKKKES